MLDRTFALKPHVYKLENYFHSKVPENKMQPKADFHQTEIQLAPISTLLQHNVKTQNNKDFETTMVKLTNESSIMLIYYLYRVLHIYLEIKKKTYPPREIMQ